MGSSAAESRLYVNQLTGSRNASLLASTLSPTKFASLDWINMHGDFGIVAGGMEDGVITLWSVAKVLQSAEEKMGRGCVGVDDTDKGCPVKSLEFNPHKQNLLASGSSEVFIRDITSLKKPTKFKPGEPNHHENSLITSISWNRIVPHILASASQDGKIVVWDLKQSKSIFQFVEPSSANAYNDPNSSFDYFNDSTLNPSTQSPL